MLIFHKIQNVSKEIYQNSYQKAAQGLSTTASSLAGFSFNTTAQSTSAA